MKLSSLKDITKSVESSFKSAVSTMGNVIKQDSFVSGLSNALSKSMDTVSGAFNLAISTQKELRSTVENVIDKGRNALNTANSLVAQNARQFFTSLKLEAVKTVNISEWTNKFEQTISHDVIGEVTKFMNNGQSQIATTFKGLSDQASSFMSGIQDISTNVTTGMSKLQSFGNQLEKEAMALGNQAMNFGNQAMNAVTGFGNQLEKEALGFGKQMEDSVTSFGNSLYKEGNSLYRQATGMGTKAMKSVESFGNQVYTQVNSFGSSTYHTIGKAVTENMNNVTNMFDSGIAKAKQGLDVVGSSVMKQFNSSVNTLNSLGSKAATTYQQITGNVSDVVKSAAEKGKNALQNGLGTLCSSAESIGNSVKNSSIVKDLQKLPGETIGSVSKTLSKLFKF